MRKLWILFAMVGCDDGGTTGAPLQGETTGPVEVRVDSDCDGVADSCQSLTKDGKGNIVKGTNCAGEPEWCYIATYAYNADGTVASYEEDNDCDGECEAVVYPGTGQTAQVDYHCDGTIDATISTEPTECP